MADPVGYSSEVSASQYAWRPALIEVDLVLWRTGGVEAVSRLAERAPAT